MTIRIATLDDSEAIARLSVQLGYSTTTEQAQQRLANILPLNDNRVWVAVADSGVVAWIHAFIAFRVETAPFVEIGGLVVDEHHRTQGIGQRLVEEVTTWARTNNISVLRVRSNVVRSRTHTFYTRLGFAEKKEQKVFDKQL